MTEDTLRIKAGLSEEDITLLHKLKSKPIKKYFKHDVFIPVTNNKLSDANRNSEVIIDKVCSLAYPLNDPRTDAATKLNYLEQEDLMMQPDDTEEPISHYHKDPKIHVSIGLATIEIQERTTEESSMKRILNVREPSSIIPFFLITEEALHVASMMHMTPEQLKISRDQNKAFLKSVYGDVPEDFCTQADTQLCSECSHFHGECE